MIGRIVVASVAACALIAGSVAAQQPISRSELRRAEAGCRRGRGDAAACRSAGSHHITQPGAASGRTAIEFLGWACDGGDGQACRILAGAFESGRRDQRIAVQPEAARTAATRGCELGDMPSCGIAERLGVGPRPVSVEDIGILVFGFAPDLTERTLRERCDELNGRLNDGRRPDRSRWYQCQLGRPMESSAAAEIAVRVDVRGRRTSEVSVYTRVAGRNGQSSPEILALEQRVRDHIIARATERFGLTREPTTVRGEVRFVPSEPSGVFVRASDYSATIVYTPAEP